MKSKTFQETKLAYEIDLISLYLNTDCDLNYNTFSIMYISTYVLKLFPK